jgi:hypothetical protein
MADTVREILAFRFAHLTVVDGRKQDNWIKNCILSRTSVWWQCCRSGMLILDPTTEQKRRGGNLLWYVFWSHKCHVAAALNPTGPSPMRMVSDKDAHRHLSAISSASHGVYGYGPRKLNCRTSPSQHFNISNREHAPLLVVASTALNRAILGIGRLCARRLARLANHTAAALFWRALTHYRSNWNCFYQKACASLKTHGRILILFRASPMIRAPSACLPRIPKT